MFFFLMIRRPPRSTRTDTLFPYTTLFRYNPMSYHNGSIWPHDNALIAGGFSRYGYRAQAAQIFEGLFAAATYVDLMRLPELFCGFQLGRASCRARVCQYV